MAKFTVRRDVELALNIRAGIVSYLANANGEPIFEGHDYDPETSFIKTMTFMSDRRDDAADDEAVNAYEDLLDRERVRQSAHNAFFRHYSVHDETGESLLNNTTFREY